MSCLFALGNGITFHRFRKNPYRPAKPGHPIVLISVRPADTQPVQPALDTCIPTRASRPPARIESTPVPLDAQPALANPPRSLNRTEKIEGLLVKLLVIVLALACVGCGFGIQHIAYVRQKNELGRKLRQKEIELHLVTQAYRSIESRLIAKAADDFRRVEACPVIAKHAPRKVPTRG